MSSPGHTCDNPTPQTFKYCEGIDRFLTWSDLSLCTECRENLQSFHRRLEKENEQLNRRLTEMERTESDLRAEKSRLTTDVENLEKMEKDRKRKREEKNLSEKIRPYTAEEAKIWKEHVNQLLKNGTVEYSNSPWRSASFLVKKLNIYLYLYIYKNIHVFFRLSTQILQTQ